LAEYETRIDATFNACRIFNGDEQFNLPESSEGGLSKDPKFSAYLVAPFIYTKFLLHKFFAFFNKILGKKIGVKKSVYKNQKFWGKKLV